MTRKKLHFHSDCEFFAGCENMLANFWASPEFRAVFEVSFSYRYTLHYSSGMKKRVVEDFPTYPLRFPDLIDIAQLPSYFPRTLRRYLFSAYRLVATIPVLFYEIFRLYFLLIRLRPDIVHINNGGFPGALSARAMAIAGRLAGTRRVTMVVNNLAVGYAGFRRRLEWPIDCLVAACVTDFITGSEAAARRLTEVLPYVASKTRAINNGIRLRAPAETSHDTLERLGLDAFQGTIFGVVAVLRKNKGHRVLLDAIKTHRGPNISEFVVLVEGDGPLRQELESYVRSHNLQDQCRFVGTEENIFDFLQAIDVLVLPSIDQEDFPNVILEAMGLGKPVIASAIAGTPEQVIDGETGILVTTGAVQELSEALCRLAADRDLRDQMGTAARQRFLSRFTAGIAVQGYLEFYAQQG